jgi:alpha-aminoadipic semialdehyde synthase
MSVDILPSELPIDSSEYFCSKFLPYLETLIRIEQGKSLSEQDKVNAAILERGTIVKKGKLAPRHEWLQQHLDKLNAGSDVKVPTPKKRVLMLGSGMVAGPTVDEISKRKDVELVIGKFVLLVYMVYVLMGTLASNALQQAKDLVCGHDGVKVVHLDIKDHDQVRQLVQEADIVIRSVQLAQRIPAHRVRSLLPVLFHPTIAQLCIEYKKHLVTASYISPEMRCLHDS